MADLAKVLGDLFLVALLPGFLAAKVRDLITARSSTGTLSMDVVRAMMYWIPIVAVLWMVSKVWLHWLDPFPLKGALETATVVAALIAAVPIGLIFGVIGETRTAQRVAFKLHLSRKTWKTPWASAFLDAEKNDCWAVVWLKDGTRLQGAPRYVSDAGKDATVYLSEVKGKTKKGRVKIRHPGSTEWVDIPGIGVLLPPSAEINHIDFLTGQMSPEDQDIANPH